LATKPFAFNSSLTPPTGATQVGNIAVFDNFPTNPESLFIQISPDDETGYILGKTSSQNRTYPIAGTSSKGSYVGNSIRFYRSVAKTDSDFITAVNKFFGQSFNSASAAKSWIDTNGHWTSFVPGIELLLDTYSGAAAAYSLRKLSSTYTGSAIRVRRSSDNTEQDIGFDGSGNLNQSTLTTFVGAGSGYVVTWYDQSGNNINMTWWQAVTQAKIVNSGTIETLNSNPCLNTTGINVFYRPNNPVAGYTNVDYQTLYAVGKIETAGNNFFVNYEDSYERIYINSSGNFEFYKNDFGTPFPGSPLVAGRTFTLAGPSTNPFVLYVNMRSLNLYASYNGNSESSLGAWGSAMRANRYLNGFGYYQGKLSEMIMWNSDQSSNKTGIDTNMNTFYSVY
jgi:hypothetical protein